MIHYEITITASKPGCKYIMPSYSSVLETIIMRMSQNGEEKIIGLKNYMGKRSIWAKKKINKVFRYVKTWSIRVVYLLISELMLPSLPKESDYIFEEVSVPKHLQVQSCFLFLPAIKNMFSKLNKEPNIYNQNKSRSLDVNRSFTNQVDRQIAKDILARTLSNMLYHTKIKPVFCWCFEPVFLATLGTLKIVLIAPLDPQCLSQVQEKRINQPN